MLFRSRNSFAPRLGNAVHRRQGKRASCREKGALLLLDDQAARVCETSLVPYWSQLRRCLLFRARTQAYFHSRLPSTMVSERILVNKTRRFSHFHLYLRGMLCEPSEKQDAGEDVNCLCFRPEMKGWLKGQPGS